MIYFRLDNILLELFANPWINWAKHTKEMFVLANPHTNFYYVPIPKNAHTNVQKQFFKLGYKTYHCEDFSELESKHQIILLREPIDKWLSGFCQDLYFSKVNYNFDDETVLDDIFSNLGLQLHTFLQTSFIKYTSSKVTFIKVDENLSHNLQTFITRVMGKPILFDNKRRGSNYDYEIKNKISNIIHTNPKYKIQLENYLKPDIELYNSVKFYTG